MTISLSAHRAPEQPQALDALAELRRLRVRLRSAENRATIAEDRAAHLEHALASNRRIGMAVGILMCRHQLIDDRAFELLKVHSQNRNVKVRELAETVIHTGAL